MKNLKKLTLLMALVSITSFVCAGEKVENVMLGQKVAKFFASLTDISIRALTKAVVKVSGAIDDCLPLETKMEIDPSEMAKDLTAIVLTAGTNTAKIAAQQVDTVIHRESENSLIKPGIISGVVDQAMDHIEKRADVVIPKTVNERLWYRDVLWYTGIVAIAGFGMKNRDSFDTPRLNQFFSQFQFRK